LRKIEVGAVNYLNTKPLLYGVENNSDLLHQLHLHKTFPARLAQWILSDTIDMGLVPTAVLPALANYEILTDFCIGADGPVASVCLFSRQPLEEIEYILLDYQSRTSVNLCKILLREYWGKQIILIPTHSEFLDRINGTTAGLVIGDRALQLQNQSYYCYDLAEAWKSMTGLPFVFAVWAANKQLPASFIDLFNDANAKGLTDIRRVVALYSIPYFDLNKYYNSHISYHFDENKKKGLNLFLELLNQLPPT